VVRGHRVAVDLRTGEDLAIAVVVTADGHAAVCPIIASPGDSTTSGRGKRSVVADVLHLGTPVDLVSNLPA
jgi:hypothetical protein